MLCRFDSCQAHWSRSSHKFSSSRWPFWPHRPTGRVGRLKHGPFPVRLRVRPLPPMLIRWHCRPTAGVAALRTRTVWVRIPPVLLPKRGESGRRKDRPATGPTVADPTTPAPRPDDRFPCSSTVERAAVNRKVGGSIPPGGAEEGSRIPVGRAALERRIPVRGWRVRLPRLPLLYIVAQYCTSSNNDDVCAILSCLPAGRCLVCPRAVIP